MPQTPALTETMIQQNHLRRLILGRLMEARDRLSAPGGEKAQKVVNGAIRQIQALMQPNQKVLGHLGGMQPIPVENLAMLGALHFGGEEPLCIAFHLLNQPIPDRPRGPETGFVNNCRAVCRQACIKAGLGDPLAPPQTEQAPA